MLLVLETVFTVLAVPVTPFTELVMVLPLELSVWEFIIFAAEPVTPFTVVVNKLVLLVLATVFTALAVAVMPFTMLVTVLPLELKVCVVDPFDAVAQLNVPEPFVLNTCPLAPSAVGKVYVVEPAVAAGAKPT